MLKSVVNKIASASALIVGMLTLLACTLRLRCLWVRFLRSVAEIGLRLKPSLYDQQDAYKQEHASGPVRNRRQKEKFCQVLRQAEAEGIVPAEAAAHLGIDRDQQGQLNSFDVQAAFEDVRPDVTEVAVQYSGGADSTMAAIIAGQHFEKVHLLTFHHAFIRAKEKSEVNAVKLQQILGSDTVIHRYLDTTQVLNQIIFGNYIGDLLKYGTLPVGWPCLACKLSFDAHTIEYACANDIGVVVDGADLRVEFQLSQGHAGMLELRRQFYQEYDIDFRHPVAHMEDTTKDLLLFGLHSDPACILYPHQGHCIGNDLLGTIYKRFYFLPKYGMDTLSDAASNWAKEKIQVCKRLLPTPTCEPARVTLSARRPGEETKPIPQAVERGGS